MIMVSSLGAPASAPAGAGAPVGPAAGDRSTRATRSWQSRTLTVSVPTAFLNQVGARKETRKATWRERGSQAGWL